MMNIAPLLVFNGDCSEALPFYMKVFDGKQVKIQTYGDNKEHLVKEHKKITPKWEDKIMHASFALPCGAKFYFSDKEEDAEFHQGNAEAIALDFAKEEDMDKIYNALIEGGKVITPIHKAFWHAMYAVVQDKYKKVWVLNCQIVSISNEI